MPSRPQAARYTFLYAFRKTSASESRPIREIVAVKSHNWIRQKNLPLTLKLSKYISILEYISGDFVNEKGILRLRALSYRTSLSRPVGTFVCTHRSYSFFTRVVSTAARLLPNFLADDFIDGFNISKPASVIATTVVTTPRELYR